MSRWATLKLIPLSREECRARLERKGEIPTPPLDDPSKPWFPASREAQEAFNRPRGNLTLKLCKSTEDIVEVDGDNEAREDAAAAAGFVQYASQYRDESTAAIVALGRNSTTGIRYTSVSRALCDVSLRRGNKKVCTVDLVSSPAAVGLKTDPSSSTSTVITDTSNDSGANDKKIAAAAFLSMRKPAGNHFVHLDGEIVNKPLGREIALSNGSIISLFGPLSFAYEVAISQAEYTDVKTNSDKSNESGSTWESLSSSPRKRKANPSCDEKIEVPEKVEVRTQQQQQQIESTPHTAIRARAHKLMIGEFTCAMCMDILVKSTFAYPCMHAFCEECSSSLTKDNATTSLLSMPISNKGTCPTCRGNVEGWGAARSFDTIVWATALQGCFDRDDAEYYLERRDQCGEDVPTEVERECILNSVGEANNGEDSNGNNTLFKSEAKIYLQPSSSKQQPLIKTLPPPSSSSTTNINGNPNNNNNNNNNSIKKSSGVAKRKKTPSQNRGNSFMDAICID